MNNKYCDQKQCCEQKQLFIRYDTTDAELYTASTVVKRVQNCNGYIAVNTGDTIVRINGMVLYPGVPGTSVGDSMTEGGNAGEIFLGNIKIVFDGGGAAPEVSIKQKFYILDKPIIQ